MTKRQPTLKALVKTALAQAQAAGLTVVGVELSQNGTVRLITGPPGSSPVDQRFEDWQRSRAQRVLKQNGTGSAHH
jgi:hypothetical protein